MDSADTQDLLDRAREGDVQARDALLRRYQVALTRWAHGRLPHHARDLSETADLVQLTLLRAFSHLDGFDPRHPGAFTAWLRQIFQNLMRDELRRSEARGGRFHRVDLDALAPQDVVAAVGADSLASYQGALETLPPDLREAVVLSLEFGLSHQELATAIGAPSANAARMRVSRALALLAGVLGDE
ncbi:RNA polymerase sigma factor [Dokdonella koreensis]|nr:sigma-70 family RNA polymerase sigma factor [Dokdonella koreensis]